MQRIDPDRVVVTRDSAHRGGSVAAAMAIVLIALVATAWLYPSRRTSAAPQAAASQPAWRTTTTLPDPAGDPSLGDVISFPPTALTVTAVADESGQPLDSFAVRAVYYYRGSLYSGGGPWTGAHGRLEKWVGGGAHALIVQVSTPDRAMVESSPLAPQGRLVNFTARLKKASPVVGTILTPAGTPAGGADVYLDEKSTSMIFQSGRLSDPHLAAGLTMSTTNGSGHYTLPPRLGPIRGLVLHDTGWGDLKRDAQAAGDRFTLTAWARVEGDLPPNVQVGFGAGPIVGGGNANAPVILRSLPLTRGRFALGQDFDMREYLEFSYLGADATGHFVADRVPDGDFDLLVGGRHYTAGPALRPGEVRKLTPAVPGRRVAIEVVLPEAFKQAQHPGTGLTLMPIAPQNPAPRRDLLTSDALQPYARSSGAGGQSPIAGFEDVPPGSYLLVASSTATVTDSLRDASAFGALRVGIPAAANDEIVDLGQITVRPCFTLQVGDAAPALDLTTLDGKPFRLADQRGHYVVLHLWSAAPNWSVQKEEVLDHLYPLLTRNGGVMLSICVDQRVDDAQRVLRQARPAWPQAFVNMLDIPDACRAFYSYSAFEPIWLIGPDGRVVMKYLQFDSTTPEYLGPDGRVVRPGFLDGPEPFFDVIDKVLPGATPARIVQRADAASQPGLLPKIDGLAFYPIVPDATPASDTVLVDDPEHPGAKVAISTKVGLNGKDLLAAQVGPPARGESYYRTQLTIRRTGNLPRYAGSLILLNGKPVGRTGTSAMGIPSPDRQTMIMLVPAYLTPAAVAALTAITPPAATLP